MKVTYKVTDTTDNFSIEFGATLDNGRSLGVKGEYVFDINTPAGKIEFMKQKTATDTLHEFVKRILIDNSLDAFDAKSLLDEIQQPTLLTDQSTPS